MCVCARARVCGTGATAHTAPLSAVPQNVTVATGGANQSIEPHTLVQRHRALALSLALAAPLMIFFEGEIRDAVMIGPQPTQTLWLHPHTGCHSHSPSGHVHKVNTDRQLPGLRRGGARPRRGAAPNSGERQSAAAECTVRASGARCARAS